MRLEGRVARWLGRDCRRPCAGSPAALHRTSEISQDTGVPKGEQKCPRGRSIVTPEPSPHITHRDHGALTSLPREHPARRQAGRRDETVADREDLILDQTTAGVGD